MEDQLWMTRTHSHLRLNEVFAVDVPFRHNRLQQVLLLFELALCLSDLLPPIKYLHLSYFNVIHFLLHLLEGRKVSLRQARVNGRFPNLVIINNLKSSCTVILKLSQIIQCSELALLHNVPSA